MKTSLRDNEGKYWTPVNRLESDSNNTRSRMNDHPFDIKSLRTEMEEMSFPMLGWALKKTILIIKEVPILKCHDDRITG